MSSHRRKEHTMLRTTITNVMAISALAAALVALLAAAPASAKPELGDSLVPGQLQVSATPGDDHALQTYGNLTTQSQATPIPDAFERAVIRSAPVRPDDRAGIRGPGRSVEPITGSGDDGFIGSTEGWLALAGALCLSCLAAATAFTAVRQHRRHVAV